MIYFVATVLTKGQRKEFGFYAENRQKASAFATHKYDGIIIKVVEEKEPLEDQFKRFKDDLLKNFKKKKIKPNNLISAMRQLAVMVNAGISIHDSLKEIASATDDPSLKIVFSKLADDINSGHSFSKAMKFFRFELGNLTIAMVELGEKTGNLDEALYALSDMLEEIRSNLIKFKKAMAYPRNVMIAMAVAFSILLTYVVPQFKEIFDQLGANLPLPTIILMTLSDFLVTYGSLVLVGIIISVIIFKYMVNNDLQFRYKWHAFLLRLILIKNIINFSTLSRFTLVFSELIRAGIPVAEALDTSIEMIENLPMKKRLQSVKFTVEKGGTLHQGLSETGLFENMILQMIRAGENSGTLDAMIKKVAEYYKMRFDAIIDGLSEAIEPIMLFFIAGIVILLALGIFLPMWDMGNAVQGRS